MLKCGLVCFTTLELILNKNSHIALLNNTGTVVGPAKRCARGQRRSLRFLLVNLSLKDDESIHNFVYTLFRRIVDVVDL